jgi:uncharacterized protein YkwD
VTDARTWLWSALLLAAVLAGAVPATADAPAPKPDSGATQHKRIYDEVAAFRRAAEPAERREQVGKILAYGRPGALQLCRHLRGDTQRRASAYARAMQHNASRLYREHRRRAPVDEVKELRKTLSALRSNRDLQGAEIAEKGGPALKRLRELLLPPPELLDRLPDRMKKERELLVELCGYRRECEKALGTEPVDLMAKVEAAEANVLARLVFQNQELRAVAQHNYGAGRRIRPEEARGVHDLNVIRFLLGLKPVRIDVKLCQAARGHSRDMAERGFFSHQSPVPGKKTPWARAARHGTKASSENIFKGSSSPEAVNLGWFHSPGHHRNMLNSGATFVGLGHCRGHWTQMFR